VAEAWNEVSVVLHPGRSRFAAYDLPLVAIGARVIARARAGRIPLALPDDVAVAGLGAVLDSAGHWPSAPVHRALFDAELGGSGSGDDVELWRAAVQAAGDDVAPAQLLPYALLRLAEALAAAGDRPTAREYGDQARSAATAIGLGLVLQGVDDLERRMGLVRVSSGSGAAGGARAVSRGVEDDLTERERQVLTLLSQGLSNRRIAETLFISVKTASVHVSNILRKTNTATRTEAAFLARSFTPRSGGDGAG
jgi:DNA-binding CsgD family transcriptional regulator